MNERKCYDCSRINPPFMPHHCNWRHYPTVHTSVFCQIPISVMWYHASLFMVYYIWCWHSKHSRHRSCQLYRIAGNFRGGGGGGGLKTREYFNHVYNAKWEVRIQVTKLKSTIKFGGYWELADFSQNAMFLNLADFKFGDSVHVCILVGHGAYNNYFSEFGR